MKKYNARAVNDYVSSVCLGEKGNLVDYIEGSLLDDIIIWHGFAIEYWEEVYVNSWESAYARHIYRKRVPKNVIAKFESLLADRMAEMENLPTYESMYEIEQLEHIIGGMNDFNANGKNVLLVYKKTA